MEEWIWWLIIIIGLIVLLIFFIIMVILIIQVDRNPYMYMVQKESIKSPPHSKINQYNYPVFEDNNLSNVRDPTYSYNDMMENNPVSYENNLLYDN